jgi:DNA-binding CsgD family transcriptional regulator
MATRVTSARIVGRTAELTELEAAVADAAAGRPSLAFIAGESGVGKTRLVAELERLAVRRHGARVLSGDCVELGEGELPYAPLVAALRPLARAGDPVLTALPDLVRADLAALLPGLAAPGAALPPAAQDGRAQARVFEALLALLSALASDRPVLLTIEDLHWADRSTRAFLAFLSASLCRERILVIGSYRPDELHRRHPLRPLLAELERDVRARRVELAPLTPDELAEQLGDILGSPPDASLVKRLHARSEGNPLFTEELLATGLDGRGGLPPTLRDALMLRIERLPSAAQEVLRLVAVGRRINHRTLAEASDAGARELREALREAVAGHILVADADDGYQFRHALLREVVEDDLLPGERGELHLALARTLEARGTIDDPQLAAAIAHHYAQAGDQPAALAASVRAATAAEEVHAFGEAAALLERALELWDRVPDPAALAGSSRVEILARTANAHDMEGDAARQETLLHKALSLVDPGQDPVLTAGLLERLHRAEWSLNRQGDALETLDRSLALLPAASGPTPERAWLLATKAKSLMLMGRFRSVVDVAQEAIAEARAVTGARPSEGRALNALGVAQQGLGDVDAGVQSLREALAIAQELGRPQEVCSGYVNLADVLHLTGRTREALAIAHEGAEVASLLGREERWLQLAVSELAFELGDWEQAAKLPEAGRRNQGTTMLNLLLRQAELALGVGDHAAATQALDAAHAAADGSREPQFLGVLGALQAEHERRAGDLTAARAAVEEALDQIEFCTDDVQRIARVAMAGVRVEADAAQQARDLGDAEGERRALAQADLLLERVTIAAEGPRPVEGAYLLTAQADRSRAAGADDPARWQAAADAWSALERPYPVAQSHWRRAEAHAAAGDRDAAARAATAALTIARDLGAGWLAAEVEGLAARARLHLTDATRHTGDAAEPAADAQADPFGLTERERQVLALVANGATNREIGSVLYMAEKTASVHVSRILAKLDVRSRTEAAGVAHRHGLAAPAS